MPTPTPDKHYTWIDRWIANGDRALRTLTPKTQVATRASPAETIDSDSPLNNDEQKHSAALMRVNHSGEVCAQALYQGQALTAKLPTVANDMAKAADEEIDHLAWCEQRIKELGERPSRLNPLWYGLSFGLGATAGLISDRVSLGFVAATEEQVCEHLRDHLTRLPQADAKSRAIVNTMIVDEQKHRDTALDAGGWEFPTPIKRFMRTVSKAMTSVSYRL